MATVAVFISMGGTAYAVATITGAQVKNESLTGADLRNGSVTGPDLKDGSIRGSDLANSSVTGADIVNGSIAATDVRDGSITAADVQDGSIGAADIKDGSIAGADVDEASLGTVPDAETLDGKNAVQVVARARGESHAIGGSYALTGSGWTQQADETDEFFGQVTYSGPGGSCMNTFFSTVTLSFQLDGVVLDTQTFGGEGRTTQTFQLPRLVFEPGTATPRTLAVGISQSANGCGPVTVESLQLNVVGYR